MPPLYHQTYLLPIRTFIAALAACLIVPFLITAPSNAEVGLKLSPTHVTPTVAVGDTTSEVITLQNESAEDMTIRGHIDAGQDQASSRLVISIEPEELILKPGESGQVGIKIAVPADIEAGQMRVMALFNAQPAAGRDIAIVGQVSSLIDVDIIHPVDQVQWFVPIIADSSSSVAFIAEATNSGKFTTGLSEKVELTGLLGTTDLLSQEQTVGVGERARMVATWEDTPIFAVKRGLLKVGSGVGAPVEKTVLFIVFPWKLTLAILLVISLVFAGLKVKPVKAKVFGGKWRKGL